MRKTLLLLSLWWTISSLSGAIPGLADCSIATSVAGSGSSFPVGTTITLIATPSSDCQLISQVAFYNGLTELGVATSSPYIYNWNTAGMPTGTYTDIYATATAAGSIGTSFSSVVIDMVGSPSFPYQTNPPLYNPALDPSFGVLGDSWLEGDSQMCLTTWPYNGSTAFPEGTCEWTGSLTVPASPALIPNVSTVDSLDGAMHTLSDFINFSNNVLSNDIGTLSSTFQTWYPQAAGWIAPAGYECDDGNPCSNGQCDDNTACYLSPQGSLLGIYNPYSSPPVDILGQWNGVITKWLSQTFTPLNATNATDWCVPTETALLNGNRSTAEDTYINSNSDGATWGDLSYVIACLNYNSGQVPTETLVNGSYNYTETPLVNNGSVYNYQQCLNLLNTSTTSGNCPATLPGTACDPLILGRSLAGAAPLFDGCAGNYAAWVNHSLTLATDEAPKFTLRAQFLNDVYIRAQAMSKTFAQGDSALKSFLCAPGDPNCPPAGGPAAQLTAAYNQQLLNGTSSTASLPNAVIYGWVDNPPSNGRPGYAHIVKVTAYSPGRGGPLGIGPLLPWIQTKSGIGLLKAILLGPLDPFSEVKRSYTLAARDGYVYVSVKRWDEDHNPIYFPNGHTLWQSLFHNLTGSTKTGQGFMQDCNGLTLPNGTPIGFGLQTPTVAGLGYAGISAQDQKTLANAFMLNDRGDGNLDPMADPKINSRYSLCLNDANALLTNAPASYACVRYIASSPSSNPGSVKSGNSGTGDMDYSLKFVDCNSIPGFNPSSPPEDLESSNPSSNQQ